VARRDPESRGWKNTGDRCWNLSRFSRSVKDALTAIERIEDAGGKLYSEEGNLGKLDRGLRLLIAEDERDRARAGFQNAVANALARGVYIARRIPFGYLRDAESRRLVPDPDTSQILVELFDRRSTRQSWAQLSKWVKENHGYYFARETIRGMINNPAYLGHASGRRHADHQLARVWHPLVHSPRLSRRLRGVHYHVAQQPPVGEQHGPRQHLEGHTAAQQGRPAPPPKLPGEIII